MTTAGHPEAARRPIGLVRAIRGRMPGYEEALAWAIVCLLLWPIPLLNRLHVESSAVFAFAGWFIAGYAALRAFSGGSGFRPVLVRRLAVLAVPMVLMSIAVIWAPNCGIVQGAGYFLLFVPPTIVLAVAAAWAQASLRRSPGDRASVRRMFARHAALGIVIAVAGPVYDLGFHPQFYTYNHVFGGVLGPIYDEELVWRWGLPVFRLQTLLWAVVLWAVGTAARARGTRAVFVAGLVGLAMVWMYGNAGRLSINTTPVQLAAAMPQVVERGLLRLHSDSVDTRTADFADWTAHELERLLGIRPDRPVEVWIYPDAQTRARLTGARVTSVAPVWLEEPQVHVLADQFEEVFPHELAHVWAREFGMPVLNASPTVGLVEGLAVALEPQDGGPTSDEIVAAAGRSYAEDLATALTPWGFWTGRGGVSYTVNGSFVGWLLSRYGADPMKEAYRTGRIERAYGRPLPELVVGWERSLAAMSSLPVEAAVRAQTRFSAPSLLEKRCPHWIPRAERRRRAALEAWALSDSARAGRLAQEALDGDPDDPSIRTTWVQITLRTGLFDEVANRLAGWADSTKTGALAVAEADLAALRGDSGTARAIYERVRLEQPASARDTRARLVARGLLAEHPNQIRHLVADEGRSPERLLALVDSLRLRPVTGAAGEWDRQRLVWSSEMANERGDLASARAFADSARSAFQRVGDFGGARWMQETVRRLEWLVNGRSIVR